jgi:hypothetical protein
VSYDQPWVPVRVFRSPLGAVLAAALLALALVGPTLAVAGPTRLSDPTVSPRSASPGEPIAFAVTYRNREGSPPDEVRVSVGGAIHLMTAASGDEAWKTGVRFSFVTGLPVGSYGVVFSATDRDRFTDEIDGGTVVIAAPPVAEPVVAAPTPPTPPTPPAPVATAQPTSAPAPTSKPAPKPTTQPAVPATPSDPTSAGPTLAPGSAEAIPNPRDSELPNPAPRPGPGDPEPGIFAGGAPGAPGGAGADGSPGDSGQHPGSAGPGDIAGPNLAGGWGALAHALEALGIDADRSGLMTLLPTAVGTAGGVTMLMAFMFFGKKRRDGEPPAPDEVLQANAARGAALPAAAVLVPNGADGPGPGPQGPFDAELAMPRWRRPSLLVARKTDPLRDTAAPAPSLSFDHGLVGPIDGRERRIIRYNVVRLLDAPDELRSAEIGFLDQGDEVQLLERSGTYWLVLCPDGRRGWLHKMTLGDVVGERASPGPRETWSTSSSEPDPAVDHDVLEAFLAARGRA